MYKIKILDSVHCKADARIRKEIWKLLKYKSVFWKPGPYAQKKVVKDASFLDLRSGIFLTGFLPLAKKKIHNLKIDKSNQEIILPDRKPKLKGITFRKDQLFMIKKCIRRQRGVILSATGSGKTIVLMGVISCYKNKNILILIHTKSIFTQIIKEFRKYGFDFNIINSDNKNIEPGINIAIKQSFVKIDPEEYCDLFDICFVDEVHHVNNRKGQYGKIIQSMLAPMKIGFTATLPPDKKKALALQGLIGPTLGELSIEEAVEKNILVRPRVTLLPVPYQDNIGDLRKYRDIYVQAIVESNLRNTVIINAIIERIKNDKTCLIMIKDIKHGHNLLSIVYNNWSDYADNFTFIQGKTKAKTRDEVKAALENREIKCVIVTDIWREGVNIKNLNTVVLAMAGKSSLIVLQAIGRGTRTWKDKSEVEIIDFVDRYKYLSTHFVERLTIYLKNKWLYGANERGDANDKKAKKKEKSKRRIKRRKTKTSGSKKGTGTETTDKKKKTKKRKSKKAR